MTKINDTGDDKKYDLPTVSVVRVPTQCGNGEKMHNRMIIDCRCRHLKKGKDDDVKTILIAVVLVDSSTSGVSFDTCLENLEEAANDLSDKASTNKLEDMDGKVVYIKAGYECYSNDARSFLEHKHD